MVVDADAADDRAPRSSEQIAAARDPLSCQSRRRVSLRAAVRLDGRATESDAEDDGAARRGRATASRGSTRRYRPGRRRRSLPPAASPPRLERGRSGAGSAGSASAASCRSSTGCCAARPTRPSCDAGASPSLPPACATSSRSMPTRGCRAKRRAGWSARWRIRSTGRASIRAAGRVVEGYGVLQPRVTPSLPIGREGSLFQRVFSGSQRHRSLRRRRSPTSTRTCSARARSPARASTTSMPSRRRSHGRVPDSTHAQPRSASKASSRARASRPTSRWSRNFPPATTSPPRASIAGRAATGSCCRGSSAGAAPAARDARRVPAIGRWKMFDNLRRTLSAPAAVVALLAGWTAAAAGRARSGRGFVLLDDRAADAAAGLSAACCRAAPASRCAATCGALGSGSRAWRCAQTALARHVPRPSGLADGRRDRAHAVSPGRQPPAPARVDARPRRPSSAPRAGLARLLPPDGRRRRASALVAAIAGLAFRPAGCAGRALPFVVAVARRRRPSRAGSACRRTDAGSRAGLRRPMPRRCA